MWALLLWMGCRDVCAPEARGGSEAERAVVLDEAERFLEGLVPQVCVPALKLDDLPRDKLGRYTPSTRRVRVQRDRDDDELRATVRHELCHAVQFQHDLDLSDDHWSIVLPVDVPPEDLPGESFAYTCQLGALPPHLAGDVCPGDEPGTSVQPFLRELFWPPATLSTALVTFTEVGSASIASGASVDVVPTAAGGLQVDERGAAERSRTVDPYTSELVGDAPARVGPAAIDGAELTVVALFAANGSVALRLAYRDALGWTRIGCLRPQEQAFALDGALWSAYVDGDRVVWGTWTR
jgi:hypothetical protein